MSQYAWKGALPPAPSGSTVYVPLGEVDEAVLMAWQFSGSGVAEVLIQEDPSIRAPVRLVAEPGSARRSPDALPAGALDEGKFPLTTAVLVAGATAQA
ncbi:MAG: hypothetical protein QMC36_01765 [Patescibacteria group bacterium]